MQPSNMYVLKSKVRDLAAEHMDAATWQMFRKQFWYLGLLVVFLLAVFVAAGVLLLKSLYKKRKAF